jgi:hypothetical protein
VVKELVSILYFQEDVRWAFDADIMLSPSVFIFYIQNYTTDFNEIGYWKRG